jgi:MerR family transcriptional regulator, light-induced transcriptional regulator
MITIVDLPDEPKYTIKAVCSQTGIRPVTLRAWERRHEVLTPHRSDNRYRLYSERDVAILRWIKNRMEGGVSISSAVNEMRSMMKNGIYPEAILPAPSILTSPGNVPAGEYVDQLYDALINHDEALSSDLMRSISSSFELHTLCTEILIPVLVDIGDAWYHGKIRVATEHFASSFIRGKLLSILQTYPIRRNSPRIMLGCGPNEQHEIGGLMLATMLRGAGYRVEFLGPDLPIEDLVDYASYDRPDMIILSATMAESAVELTKMQKELNKMRKPPLFGYGGRAFNSQPELRAKMGGVFLGTTLDEAIASVTVMLPINSKS